MIDIGKQITLWRKSRRLTQEALQDLCGWGSGNGRISHYETLRSEPGMKELSVIAKSLGIELRTLIFERPGSEGKQKSGNVNLHLGNINNVPVYSMVTAHRWRSFTMEDAQDHIALPKSLTSDNCFIVTAKDSSCSPNYLPGTRFLISQAKPTAGDLVLARLPDSDNAIRVYKRPTPSSYTLHALNDNFADYDLDDPHREHIIGTVSLVISEPPKL